MFSGHEGMGWKSWNDTTRSAVKSLEPDSRPSVKANRKPLIKAGISPEEQISILLDSADDGAKMIVS